MPIMPATRRASSLAGLPTLRVSRVFLRPAPFPRRGLGAGTAAGEEGVQIAGTGATIGFTLAGATAAIPIVGAVVALGALLASFLGGGCGQACIASSQAEQIYEVACDDLQAVANSECWGKTII